MAIREQAKKAIPSYPPPAPGSPPIEITAFPAKSIAEVLTVLDQMRFTAIEGQELLNVAWTGPEKVRYKR